MFRCMDVYGYVTIFPSIYGKKTIYIYDKNSTYIPFWR